MSAALSPERIQQRVSELGPWFHNLNLGGVQTAPEHFLGDYPAVKWQRFARSIPQDLAGRSVLDIGCNAGFYAIEMKRRGAARVLGIDTDERYLAQARFAAEVCGARHRVPADVGLRSRATWRAIRPRALHGRALPPPPSAARTRHPPRTRRRRHARVPVDAARQRRTGARRPDYLFWESEHLRGARAIRACTSSSTSIPAIRPTGGSRTGRAPRRCCGARDSKSSRTPKPKYSSVAASAGDSGVEADAGKRSCGVIEAVMLWNEPNNMSHWDFEIDPGWKTFGEMVKRPAAAIAAERPALPRVLGGMSPIDPNFISDTGGPGRARRGGRRRGARLPARLEPLADRRVAATSSPRSARSPSCRSG